MKITNIAIEHCGIWHHLNLPLPETGLSVFYGPNEAGKTTLMRFVRGMLHGFPQGETAGLSTESHDTDVVGAITLSTDEGDYSIRRSGGNALALTGPDGAPSDPDKLEELLGNVDETVFQRVFAIGIRELQELGSLHEEEVADRIYGMTLGPRSMRILDALENAETASLEFVDAAGDHGKLIELLQRHDDLQSQLSSLDILQQEYIGLFTRRKKLQAEIGDVQSRQSGIESQLRGHLYMQRAYGPWKLVRDCAAELEELPVVNSFPENGVERLNEIELELAEAAEQRDRLKTEAKALSDDSNRFAGDAEVIKHEHSLQGMVDQRDWIVQIEQHINESQTRRDSLRDTLQQSLSELGEEWSLEKLYELDTGPVAYQRLVSKARSFKGAIARREKLKLTSRRLGNTCAEQQADLTRRLEESGAETVQSGLEAARARLTELETLGELKLQERDLHQRQIGIDELREQTEVRMSPPPSFYIILWVMIGCALISFGGGLLNGVSNQLVVSGIFALFGVIFVLLGRLAKRHFEHGMDQRITELNETADRNREELRATREEILRLAGDSHDVGQEEGQDASMPELIAIRQSAREIAEFESLVIAEQTLIGKREKLERANNQLYDGQRDVAGARQSWEQTLTKLGLPESLEVAEAYDLWQTLVDLTDKGRHLEVAEAELQSHRTIHTSFSRRVAEIGRRMHQWDLDFEQPTAVIDHWEEQLKQLHVDRDERRRLRHESKARLREASTYREIVGECKTKRSALLIQGGAADREEFEHRAHAISRRILLERQLEQAEEDLRLAGESDNELAVTEEDLELFDPTHNTECIELLKMEQEDLRTDLQAAYEQLGGLKREIEVLEGNGESRRLRRELDQVRREIQTAGVEWLGLVRARQAVEQMRRHAERTHQPVTIADASRYLSHITCGKYRNIWTPLGQRHLRIDDERGHSLPVEKLSRGTREQLFLAIRMALIHDFARNGVSLPVVLDDVLVNFDEDRTAAAVDALLEFARGGHQVLMFTCHRHLAQMVQAKGQDPIWLPSHAPAAEAA